MLPENHIKITQVIQGAKSNFQNKHSLCEQNGLHYYCVHRISCVIELNSWRTRNIIMEINLSHALQCIYSSENKSTGSG